MEHPSLNQIERDFYSAQQASWLSDACTTRKDSELEWLAKDHLETNPITIKPDIASHVAEQFSWVPLPYCSPPGCLFPIKSLALSAHVSPRTIHFRVLDKSPVSGPGRGPPSCNTSAGWGLFYLAGLLETSFFLFINRLLCSSEQAMLGSNLL